MIKPEIRMTKSERNLKFEIQTANSAASPVNIQVSDFGLLSTFGFRYSDFQT